jgi:hypothetical protein
MGVHSSGAVDTHALGLVRQLSCTGSPDKGGMESMELSHEPIPFRDGGTEFVPRWPQDHAAVDPFRFPGY